MRVKIRQKGNNTPARILEVIDDSNGTLLCKDSNTGSKYVYAKSMSYIEYLDTPEEEKKSGNTESLEQGSPNLYSELVIDIGILRKELTERVEKLEWSMNNEMCDMRSKLISKNIFSDQNIPSPNEVLEHKMDSLENVNRLTERVEKLEIDYPFNFNRVSELYAKIEKLENIAKLCSGEPTPEVKTLIFTGESPQQTWTRDEVVSILDKVFYIKSGDIGIVLDHGKRRFLSELDKMKEVKDGLL